MGAKVRFFFDICKRKTKKKLRTEVCSIPQPSLCHPSTIPLPSLYHPSADPLPSLYHPSTIPLPTHCDPCTPFRMEDGLCQYIKRDVIPPPSPIRHFSLCIRHAWRIENVALSPSLMQRTGVVSILVALCWLK